MQQVFALFSHFVATGICFWQLQQFSPHAAFFAMSRNAWSFVGKWFRSKWSDNQFSQSLFHDELIVWTYFCMLKWFAKSLWVDCFFSKSNALSQWSGEIFEFFFSVRKWSGFAGRQSMHRVLYNQSNRQEQHVAIDSFWRVVGTLYVWAAFSSGSSSSNF